MKVKTLLPVSQASKMSATRTILRRRLKGNCNYEDYSLLRFDAGMQKKKKK
jgi:hypothetical protein